MRPPVAIFEARHHAQRGGLAAPRWSEQDDELALVNIEIDPFHRARSVGVGFLESGDAEKAHGNLGAGRLGQHVPGDNLEDRARQGDEETPLEAAVPEGLQHEQRSDAHSVEEDAVGERYEVTV